ncbi:MAG TPA: ribokinase [Tepidisphaeraceae bacterium]|nr:ribokinase [Tepidisphaeraceae bacterium]
MPDPRPIVVIGSVNMDLVLRARRIPAPGETLLGDSFMTVPGGKGANQAVAAARLARKGTTVHLVARVGDDDFGQRLLNGLEQHHVNTRHVVITEGTPSGIAMILVDKRGENTIVVASGANARLSPQDIDAAEGIIATAAAVVLQLEIPLATVAHALALCEQHGVYTILDPAPVPAKGLPRALYGVDVLTPNRPEAEALLGVKPRRDTTTKRPDDPKMVASRLLSRGAKAVVLKRGGRGALLIDRGGAIKAIKANKVNVVDTTAAGDAFTAALAVGRAEGMELEQAVRFACAAGALSCQAFGAQPALPAREAVDRLAEEGR